MDEEQLRQTIEDLARQLREGANSVGNFSDSVEQANKDLGKFFKNSLGDAANGVKSFSGSVINGSKGFNSLIPVVNSLGKVMAGLAGTIPLVGRGASKFVEGATEASKFLIGELGKQVGTFQEVSKSGVLAAGGMTEFSKQAFSSRLTLQQFGRIVTDNGRALAAMRGSAFQGADALSDITSVLSDDGGMFARRLGFSAEEIADITAGFLTQQTRLGRTQGRTTEALTAQTETYIKELDLLSKLTGDNRKELQRRQEATLRETRFSAMIAGLREQEGKRILDFVTLVESESPRFAAGMKDLLTAGTATTEEGRQLMMLSGGRAREIAQAYQSGSISITEATQQLQQAVGPNLDRFRSLTAVLGDSNELTAGFAQNLAFATRSIEEFGKVSEVQAQQMAGADDMTATMVSAQKNIEDFAMNLNKMILELMPITADVTEALTGQLERLSDLASSGLKVATGKSSLTSEIKSHAESVVDSGSPLFHAMAGGGTLRPKTPTIVGEQGTEFIYGGQVYNQAQAVDLYNALALQLGNLTGNDELNKVVSNSPAVQQKIVSLAERAGYPGDVTSMSDVERKRILAGIDSMFKAQPGMTSAIDRLGYADGGVVSGPKDGYQATLHGTEAVVPLPDGQSIPVEVKSSQESTKNTELLEAQVTRLDEMIRIMGRHLNVSEQTRSQLM